jgi:SAM-dependent methyltransferase
MATRASRSKAVKRRREFFFAEAAAGMYDVTIGSVVPNYAFCHRFSMYLLEHQDIKPGDAILDVGSGTGADSIAILRAFPKVHVYSVDLCSPIQQIHLRKLRQLDSPTLKLESRSTLVCSDIAAFDSGSSLLENIGRNSPFTAVVSGFTIHHLRNAEKARFYRLAYEVLRPGGALINADLYSYANREMNRRALEFDLNWMRKEFINPSCDFTRQIPRSRRVALLKLWIDHYHSANRLHPLEDVGKVRGQVSMVNRAGFRRTAIPYRLSLSGILYARK